MHHSSVQVRRHDLRTVREARTLTRQELADVAQCDRSTISRLESGTLPAVHLDLATRIAAGLGVPVAAVFVMPRDARGGRDDELSNTGQGRRANPGRGTR